VTETGKEKNAQERPRIIWAPWRIAYIKHTDKEPGCIFCRKPAEDNDAENYIVFRGETAFIMLNRYPYNNGHLLLAPYRHTGRLADLDAEESAELMRLLQLSQQVLEEEMSPQGFNIGMNLGRTAGAGIEDHLHFHVVPRWSGDTNFMPVCGQTKVVSEGLAETWSYLQAAFKRKMK